MMRQCQRPQTTRHYWQELVGGKKVDAVSGASKKEAPETADSVSSASVHEEESATDKPTVDSVSSASIKE